MILNNFHITLVVGTCGISGAGVCVGVHVVCSWVYSVCLENCRIDFFTIFRLVFPGSVKKFHRKLIRPSWKVLTLL